MKLNIIRVTTYIPTWMASQDTLEAKQRDNYHLCVAIHKTWVQAGNKAILEIQRQISNNRWRMHK